MFRAVALTLRARLRYAQPLLLEKGGEFLALSDSSGMLLLFLRRGGREAQARQRAALIKVREALRLF
jgi:hypothetical protein